MPAILLAAPLLKVAAPMAVKVAVPAVAKAGLILKGAMVTKAAVVSVGGEAASIKASVTPHIGDVAQAKSTLLPHAPDVFMAKPAIAEAAHPFGGKLMSAAHHVQDVLDPNAPDCEELLTRPAPAPSGSGDCCEELLTRPAPAPAGSGAGGGGRGGGGGVVTTMRDIGGGDGGGGPPGGPVIPMVPPPPPPPSPPATIVVPADCPNRCIEVVQHGWSNLQIAAAMTATNVGTFFLGRRAGESQRSQTL